MKISIFLTLIYFSKLTSSEIYFTKFHHQLSANQTHCVLLNNEVFKTNTNKILANENIEKLTYPAVNTPDVSTSDPDCSAEISYITEIYSNDQTENSQFLNEFCATVKKPENLIFTRNGGKSSPEVRKLVDGGDPLNRIDIVFMGDGYKLEESDKFFEDITRLVEETFFTKTFRNYLLLFNIWAVFVPSKDSGIGYNNSPKNTPFKLYRPGGILRGIYTKNPTYARQICKLTGPSGCDYPSLIANDDYYGGLGGEFSISTRSPRTGSIVLRHEFGHNFAKVGEEYDSGEVYSGANSAPSLRDLKWKSWLSGNHNHSGRIKEERQIYRILAYPTNDLDKRPLAFNFKSDGSYSRWYLFISITGAGEPDSVQFILDGQALSWQSKGSDDKEFYEWFGPQGFTKGGHNLTIISTVNSANKSLKRIVPRMVGSVTLYEFGTEEEFHSGQNYIAAYPTWDYRKRKFYRPTNAGCLMRNMTHTEFCSVCKEEMWLQFFKRINLIEGLKIETNTNYSNSSAGNFKNVTLKTLELGQFRKPGTEVEGERLEIKWFKDGKIIVEFSEKVNILATNGKWKVEVRFVTPEVRNDPKGLLLNIKSFDV